MKFGEHLLSNLTPEWNSQYIQYEYMKELLEKTVAAAPIVLDGEDNSLREQYFRQADLAFFEYCEKQATKINTFFTEKISEAQRRFVSLKDEVQYRQKMYGTTPPPPRKTSTVVIRGGKRISSVNGNTGIRKRSSMITPLTRILPDRLLSNFGEEHKEPSKLKNIHSVKVAFSEFYLMLVLLQKYQLLNFTGFRKILKKHDKLFQTTRGEEWRKLHIDTAKFWTSPTVTEMIQEVETVYTEALESGDRSRAMKHLRVPPLEERQSPIVTFRLGIFVGMNCILFAVLIICIAVFNKSRTGNPLAWRQALQLYRSSFLIICQIIFCGLNIYGWTKGGVNHILIFGIDPRHHLTYQQVLEVGTGLMVAWLVSFIAFIVMSYIDYYPFTQPLVFFIGMILFLINPIPIFYRPARYWFLKTIGLIFTAAFHPISFSENWLCNQMASLELAFFDMEYFFCFYISDRDWWSTNLTDPAIPRGPFCLGWSRFVLQAFLLAIPSSTRLVQCVRRYYDSKTKFPHLANAGKYSTSVMVAITNSVRRGTNLDHLDNPRKNPFVYTWIAAAFVSSTYKLIWDLKMDWGLFDKNAGENKFLREHIVYSKKGYYYYAIIQDIVFRYLWTINIFIQFTNGSAEYSDITGFAFGFVEILRRFLWNFFRLENEHLNNCGKFRAIRDISIAPIKTGVNFKLIGEKLSKQPGIRSRRGGSVFTTIAEEDEDLEINENLTKDDKENNTEQFLNNPPSTLNHLPIVQINEIAVNIPKKRRHSLMPSNVPYPIFRIEHTQNKLLTPSKSL